MSRGLPTVLATVLLAGAVASGTFAAGRDTAAAGGSSLEPGSLPEADRSLERLVTLRRERLVAAGFDKRTSGEGDGALVWFVAGDGPPLLLLHGAGDQAGTWFEVAPAFVDRFRVVAPDLPGHGESAPSEGPLAMSAVVAGAERLLAEIAVERPAVVVGNSMGAWIGTILALRHPEQVERLVLVDGGAIPGPPGAPSLLPSSREAAARLMQTLRDPASPPTPDWLLDDLVRRAPTGATARMLQNLPDLLGHLLVGRLGEVTTPVDLLWGSSDGLMTLDYARQMRSQLAAARLTEIEHCGHIPQLECPQRFVTAPAELLASLPPTPAAPAATMETPE